MGSHNHRPCPNASEKSSEVDAEKDIERPRCTGLHCWFLDPLSLLFPQTAQHVITFLSPPCNHRILIADRVSVGDPRQRNTIGDVVESEISQPKNRECSSDASPYHTNHPSLHLTSFMFEVFKHLLQLLRQWSLNLENLTSCVQQGNAAAVEEEP